MKNKFLSSLMIALLGLTFLSGCQVSAKGDAGKVSVETGDMDDDDKGAHDEDGNFCPPGQKKKGRC